MTEGIGGVVVRLELLAFDGGRFLRLGPIDHEVTPAELWRALPDEPDTEGDDDPLFVTWILERRVVDESLRLVGGHQRVIDDALVDALTEGRAGELLDAARAAS